MNRKKDSRVFLPALLVVAVAVVAAPLQMPAEACDCDAPFFLPCDAWYLDDPDVPLAVFCVPDGSGDPLTEARGFDGDVHDGTIVVLVRNPNWDPCPGVPAEDIWLDVRPDIEDHVNACPFGTIADGPTDLEGLATFSEPLALGGYSDPYNDVMLVYVSGNLASFSGFTLAVNSADINGDLMVDLTDIGLFAQDFYGGYNFRSDFVFDVTLNLSDIGRLAAAIGASCLPE